MSRFRQPQYLSTSDEPTNRIRCPIHGFIHYSDNERRIIGHRLFQRLRYIRQLALTEFVYPGANHTRFEHTLGVMHLATSAFDMLASKYGDRLESEFKNVAGFDAKPLAMARQLLRVATLLHDVGHAAFSHAAEEAVHKDLGHESLSVQLIKGEEFLAPTLNAAYGEGFANRVAQLLDGQPALPPQLQVLKDIVSGEMDADRSDYLTRDSHHLGVDYGRFEYRRLIESIAIDDEGGKLELALNKGGLHAFEALILARYQMSTQVYYHRLRRTYDTYLIRYHEALDPTTFDSAQKIVAQNDMTMLARIMADAELKDEEHPRIAWAKRIVKRDHHKVVFEPGIHVVAGHDLAIVPKVLADLRARYDKVEFLDDVPKKPIRIHKLLMPAEESGGVDLMVLSGSGERKPAARSSQIFSSIPKSFRPIRIFANVESRAERREISQYASARWATHGGTT